MRKLRSIILWECLTYLKKPSFLFTAFGIPLLIMVILGVVIFVMNEDEEFINAESTTRYGYVDLAEFIDESLISTQEYGELFIEFDNVESARAALDDRDSTQVQAYFVIAEDYRESGKVQVFSYEDPPDDFRWYINRILRTNLLEQVGEEAINSIPLDRVSYSAEVTIRVQDSGREMGEEGFIPLAIIPFVFAIVLVLAAQVTGGFLMSGLVEEKTNRIMEILVTSITPEQLLIGKIIGLGLLGLVQLTFWAFMGYVILGIGAGQFEFLEGVTIPLDVLIVVGIYFLLGYSLVSTILAGIGAVVGSEQESRQYAGIISMILFIPYFFLVMFIENPNGTIPTVLSLIPLTAPMAMLMRYGFTPVPLWQLALSITLLASTVVLIAWLSAQIFRWGLLRYGKKLRLRDLLKAVRNRRDMGTVGEVTS